jgi:hypothetical protein
MTITASQVKDIKTEFAKLRPAKITLDGNRSLTVKEAVFALAPTLERMKKRGFDSQELAEKLKEKGIEISPATLTKYLSEFRRKAGQKADKATADNGTGKTRQAAATPPHVATAPGTAKATAIAAECERKPEPWRGGFVITPDMPDDEL